MDSVNRNRDNRRRRRGFSTDTTTIADTVRQVLAEMEPFIENTIRSAVTTAIGAIVPEIEKSVRAENDQIGQLKAQVQSQAFAHDRLEQYSRRENIRFHGVPEKANENTDDVVISIARDMVVRIESNDISVGRRLPKTKSMRERPIIVKFTRRKTKSEMMQNQRKLCDIDQYRKVYVKYDLTPTAAHEEYVDGRAAT